MIETDNILTTALSEALETMAFLMVMPMENDLAIPQNTVLAEIDFTGPQNGTIQIFAGLDFCRVLAENTAVLNEADNETSYDALKEFANVVCGLLLPKIASSPADEFDVTIPSFRTGDLPQWGKFTSEPNCCVSNIEGYLVAARLIIKN